MIRTALITAALGALAFTTTACNTVQGLGEDISSVGRAGEDVIDGDGGD